MHYFGSAFLHHAMAEDMFTHFKVCLIDFFLRGKAVFLNNYDMKCGEINNLKHSD